jgi:leucyl-tRNA synthetase
MTTDTDLTDPDGEATTPCRYTSALAQEIELGWQARWAQDHTFEVPNPVGDLASGFDAVSGRSKFYVIDMFPYPSGAGLHVGHPLGFIASDVVARYQRMLGRLVLHPFGYDAFGLPAEQYAIETGQHPAVTIRHNIDNMRRQLRRLGLMHDPRREISTADPSFYKWTQWIFLQIFGSWYDPEARRARPISELINAFERGERTLPDGRPWTELSERERSQVVDDHRLVYLADGAVNWCPGLGTVLANEEVTIDGRSEVGNYPVYRRTMRQWMMRITAFADRLVEGLDDLDWTESLKTMQRNWIGRSEGAEVTFIARARPGDAHNVVVYTTRPDTLFGATYMVLAPEHPLVDALTAEEWPEGTPELMRQDGGGIPAESPRAAAGAYRRTAAARSDRERMAGGATTGVFLGSTATNPVTGEQVPVFIADYVLMGYGTGAIMAVPAHDERDFLFARTFGLPIRAVVEAPAEWRVEHGWDTADNTDTWTASFDGAGTAINSCRDDLMLDGMATSEAKAAMIEWLEATGNGRRRIAYRLRDWLFSRQRYWGEPFPIVYDKEGTPRALPETLLPIELPQLTQFKPEVHGDEDEPKPPLARAAGWNTVTLDLGDGPKEYRRETNTMPQWAGSCWYYLRYLDPTNNDAFVDPSVEQYWMGSADDPARPGGVDLYIGGVEHAVLHLLYARFWHKVLYDLGHVSTPEPFQRLYNQGYILAPAYTDPQGRYVPAAEVEGRDGAWFYGETPVTQHAGKMGKSLKNSVAPDDIYAAYGADTLRLYEMAMGPLDVDRSWRTDDIVGVWRFLQRLWRNLVDERTGQTRVGADPVDPSNPLYTELHTTIDAVRRHYELLRFNVAVSRLIGLNNALTQYEAASGAAPADVAEALVLMVTPLAPHVGAELWQRLGHGTGIEDAAFPVADAAVLASATVALPVTVDGRRRGEITVARDAPEEAVLEAALEIEQVARFATVESLKKVVYVPNRILNLVTES